MQPRAILIDVIPPQTDERAAERRLRELAALTQTYGGLVVVKLIQRRAVPSYRTYIGPGKLSEIFSLVHQGRANLLIVNNLLKPKQLFAIEEEARRAKTPLQVWDRIDLILKIFAQHADTSEAKLQIKLAAIRHMGPRIFGMGAELMQQAGGIGGRAGQGESNTEMMRRHLATQEERTRRDLERVAASRQGHRVRRDRLGLKTASLVGYTNAGKSSLLNALTRKGAYVANELFATLDTRVGKLWLSETKDEILLSDTIGFIQDLPPQLIDAFRSTLDETVDADLLLHVIDASDPDWADKVREVEGVLEQIGAADKPKIYVFNKVDRADALPKTALAETYARFTPVFASTVTGQGLDELKACLAERIQGHLVHAKAA